MFGKRRRRGSLPKVWVRVKGLREELREFLELWAVGSLVGSTQTVDMETTRKSDFGRVFVAVLNPLLIPAKLDVVIGDHYFELEFEVERKGFDENGEETEFEWTGVVEEEGEVEVHDREKEEGREAKRPRNESVNKSLGGGSSSGGVVASLKEKIQNMSEEEFKCFLVKQANELLDKVVDKTSEGVTEKGIAANAVDFPMEEVDKGGEEVDDLSPVHVEEGEVLKGATEQAAIKEMTLTPTRCSPRLVNASDEHTLSKVGKRAAQRNLEHLDGNILNNPLYSPLHADTILNIQSLGVCVSNDSRDLADLLERVKLPSDDLAQPRLVDNIEEDLWLSESEDENVELVENLAVKELCGDLLEEVFDDDSYHLGGDFKTTSKRYKSRAKSRKRMACRVAAAKITKMVSK